MKKVLIVGLGLIGGSYAIGLKKKGFYVAALTKNQSSIDFALKNNIIDKGTITPSKEFFKGYNLIVFALYPNVFIQWIKDNQDLIEENAILTDVTGVKECIVYEIQSILRKDLEFVPAHPMAGKEVYGVENADCEIFKKANYIITPTELNSKKAIEVVKEIGVLLEFENISIITPKQHDEMIAFLSQLTHCIAISLMCSKKSKHLVEYTGDSFRDLTRIANINESMWTELFLLNKEQLVTQMNLFIEKFLELKDAIENNEETKIKEMMVTSTKRRSYFDK